MPTLDTAAKAALDQPVIAPAQFIFLDIAGDPIRATTFAANVTPSGTGDADLDGQTFSAIDPQVLRVGEVTHSASGSETLSVELSGLVTIDTDLLNGMANPALWRGRLARLWLRVHDEAGAAQGNYFPIYTGYMASVAINPSPDAQTIELRIENYLAAFSAPSNRSYLNQRDYDPLDASAAATISSVNGSKVQNVGPALGAGSSGGGGSGSFSDMMRQVAAQ